MKRILSVILCFCLMVCIGSAAAAEEAVGSDSFLLKIHNESGLEISYLRFNLYLHAGDAENYAGFVCSCPNEGEDFYRFEYDVSDPEELKNLKIDVSYAVSDLPPEEAILRVMTGEPEDEQYLLTLDFVPELGAAYDLNLVPGEGDAWLLVPVEQSLPGTDDSAETPRATVKYEGVFLDNDEVDAMLQSIRGEAPYPKHSSRYHITTVFAPEQDARALYGKEVEVRVIGYKACEAADEEGNTSFNEGLKVVLYSDDPAMAEYLSGIEKNFHITGSYTVSAKNTEYIDFSDMEPVEYTLRGVFGASLEGIGISFDAADVGRPLEKETEEH